VGAPMTWATRRSKKYHGVVQSGGQIIYEVHVTEDNSAQALRAVGYGFWDRYPIRHGENSYPDNLTVTITREDA
jgi:hypothetical protein